MLISPLISEIIDQNVNQCLECLFPAPGPQGTPGDGGFNMMMMLMAWLVIATALFLLRPQALRGNGAEKPANNGNVSQDTFLVCYLFSSPFLPPSQKKFFIFQIFCC